MKEFDWAELAPLATKVEDNKKITGLIENCVKEVRKCKHPELLNTLEDAFVPCYLYMAVNSGFKPGDGNSVAILAAYIIVHGWDSFVRDICEVKDKAAQDE